MDVEDKKVTAPEIRPLGTNVASLVRDIARLLDLQLQLLALDVKQFWAKARVAITVSLLAAMAILGSFPVLLFGIAEMLQRMTQWSHEACLLTLGMTFTIGGACVLWFAVIRVGQAAISMKGSQEELAQNLKWVREVLHREE
jgi:heme/copper-type cytochrome/quinol oxidase subunit 1